MCIKTTRNTDRIPLHAPSYLILNVIPTPEKNGFHTEGTEGTEKVLCSSVSSVPLRVRPTVFTDLV